MTPENVPQKRFGEIALCLSGGGYRAATYALGTLDLLDELDLLADVKLLSTVSGGTFTGVSYAVSQSEGTTFGAFYERFSTFLKNTNCIDNALKDLYDTPSPSGSTDLSLIRSAAKSYSACLFGTRTFKQLLDIAGADARFKELIFNATEFREGNSFRFRASWDKTTFIGNQNFAVPREVADEVSLADIVASSSCFPGAFEPFRFPDDFRWQSSLDTIRGKLVADVVEPFPPHGTYENGFNGGGKCIPLPLMDGGVFDNQGIASAILADNKNNFGLFLVSDTSQRDNDILNMPDACPRRGWVSLETLFWIAVALFVLSLVAIGVIAYSFFYTGGAMHFAPWQIIVGYIISILPAFLLIGVLAWIYSLFLKAKTVVIADAKFRLWHYFKNMALPDAIEIVKTRVNSVMALTTNIFMKRIRQLQFNNLLNAESRARLVSFNLIYTLNIIDGREWLWNLDPELKPTGDMQKIATVAEEMPTTLWMTGEQFKILVACGRASTCFSLLKYLWQKWDTEEKAAKKHNPPAEVPKPNDPASDYYEIYTRLKAKWLELKENPFGSQNRERV
ncbi:MAG TPA: patatin-like phospholipase family protein [Pyrinomonadaceae bacterium]|jgi:predicted acylesterase/phospholipase RssA